MRRTLIGLAAAGLLVAAACSDSDSGDDASSSGGGSTEQFCDELKAIDQRFTEDPEAANDPEAVVAAFEELEPPEEIAEDFDAVIEVYSQSADVDFEDPEAVAEAQTRAESVADSEERVGTFLDEKCDLGSDTTEGSTDTTAAG